MTRILCNVCTGEAPQIARLLAEPFLPLLTDLLEAKRTSLPPQVLITVIHAMANLCANNGPGQEALLISPLLPLVVDIYRAPGAKGWSIEVDIVAIWLFSNLLGSEATPAFEPATALVALVCSAFLRHSAEDCAELQLEALWAILNYVRQGDHKTERVGNIAWSPTFPLVIKLANRAAIEGAEILHLKPMIAIIGNCFSSTNEIIERHLTLELAEVA